METFEKYIFFQNIKSLKVIVIEYNLKNHLD